MFQTPSDPILHIQIQRTRRRPSHNVNMSGEVPPAWKPHHDLSPSTNDHKKVSLHAFGGTVACGCMSGVLITTALNPWDRALFLSIVHQRPFLDRQNFRHPYQGVFQTMAHRSVSYGLYFPLEQLYCDSLKFGGVDDKMVYVLAGCMVGATNAILLNPLAYVKYYGWSSVGAGRGVNQTDFVSVARSIFQQRGVTGLFRGTGATVCREVTFGATFCALRHRNRNKTEDGRPSPWVNFSSCFMATLASSPFNFARNMQYDLPLTQQTTKVPALLLGVWREIKSQPTFVQSLAHVQDRFRIGWGTARTSCGMMLTDIAYRNLIKMSE